MPLPVYCTCQLVLPVSGPLLLTSPVLVVINRISEVSFPWQLVPYSLSHVHFVLPSVHRGLTKVNVVTPLTFKMITGLHYYHSPICWINRNYIIKIYNTKLFIINLNYVYFFIWVIKSRLMGQMYTWNIPQILGKCLKTKSKTKFYNAS